MVPSMEVVHIRPGRLYEEFCDQYSAEPTISAFFQELIDKTINTMSDRILYNEQRKTRVLIGLEECVIRV